VLPLQELEVALQAEVQESKPLAGGDICRAFRVTLTDGRTLFVKVKPGGPSEMFPTEAKGLDWLREAGPLRIPEVVHSTASFLALEFLPSGPRRSTFDEELGRGLARLHRSSVARPGLDHDNFIGPLPQPNEPCPTWAEFYARKRLEPRVKEAVDSGSAPSSWRSRFEELYEKLPQLIPDEPLSPLHGDLWGGNLHTGPEGEPCLIDPAVYGGHREVDLAMMKLFGGFSPTVFRVYDQEYPRVAGHEDRVDLYQLYPLLVHTVLFGGGYAQSVESVLSRYL